MARSISLQVRVSPDLAARLRAHCASHGVSLSERIRALILDSLDGSGSVERDRMVRRTARQMVFVMIGVDALLAGHPDPDLRTRSHQAYARKCRELGIVSVPGEGDEA